MARMDGIFYFTGTGNALAISRTLAEGLGDTEVHRMTPEGADIEGVERIGLVFPVFGWGMPRMVAEFVGKLRPTSDQYVFGVATCGGSQAATLRQLRKVLRSNGSDLDAGFSVHGDFEMSFPKNELMAIIRLMVWLSRNHRPAHFSERTEEILRVIQAKERRTPETSGPLANLLGTLIGGVARTSFRTADKAFGSTDACTSCGICARVCPRENVTLENGRPAWHHDCEFCYACMAFCPQNAITMNGQAPNTPAHHPDVSLNDVLWR
jgi:ferredoxin/flavodoxin